MDATTLRTTLVLRLNVLAEKNARRGYNAMPEDVIEARDLNALIDLLDEWAGYVREGYERAQGVQEMYANILELCAKFGIYVDSLEV